jgi:hypothetical protein
MQDRVVNIQFSAIILALTLAVPQVFFAQADPSARSDSVSARADTSGAQSHADYEEQILETIKIEAVVEKPNVILIPRRAETEVGQIPFGHRSFDNELKEKPKIMADYGKELESTKRIKKMKKVLAKESK